MLLEDILELYAAIIGATTTQAADQLRNRSGLESALTRPASHAHYESADLAVQAAVLAHGIAEGQPFVDGNKRLALIAMPTSEAGRSAPAAAAPGCFSVVAPSQLRPISSTTLSRWLWPCRPRPVPKGV